MRRAAQSCAALLIANAAIAPVLAPVLAPTRALAADPGADLAADRSADLADGADPTPSPVAACLSCHVDATGALDIVGVEALEGLPAEWPFLFEDAYDLDGDGVAGAMRFVSTDARPQAAKYGQSLAAARFEDFALIAAAAHAIDLSRPEDMEAVKQAFVMRSLDPDLPFADPSAQAQFEARGCASCHVTRTYSYGGKTYMPLSDFLLHDLGDGPRRTTPLWGCPTCLTGAGHGGDGGRGED